MAEGDRAPGRRRRTSLRAYLGALLLLFLLVIGVSVAYERQRNVADAEGAAEALVTFRADVAADELDRSLRDTKEAAAGLAANPAIVGLFAAPRATCTLTFTGAGAFPEGHLDAIDSAGQILCSSRPVDEGVRYAMIDRLMAAGGPAVHGPFVDPASGRPSLAVTAPVGERGVVAAVVHLDAVPSELAQSFGGALDTTFTLIGPDGGEVGPPVPSDAISRGASIPSMPWRVEASVDRSMAVASAENRNDTLLLIALGGAVALVAATLALHHRLARPIERLGAAVRSGLVDDGSSPVRASDPREVVELAEDFAEMRREVAEELVRRRTAEDRYRVLFSAHPVPMWVYDVETLRFLVVNDAAVDTYGYSREELLAMTVADIRPPEDLPAVLASIRDNPRRVRSGPWRHVYKDGRVVEVEITSDALVFDGRDARVVLATDVTQRERAQRLLQRTQRMETLGQLAGGIAHDFNNVLAIIVGFGELTSDQVKRAAEDDPARWALAVESIDAVLEAARRASTLTDQLLDFARGEDATRAPLDLNDTIRRLSRILPATLGAEITLELELDEALRPAVANAGQIEQIVVNLAVNARDAMPDGGCLLIETTDFLVEDTPELEVATHPDLPAGPYVRLRVSDTGTGMTQEERENAFEPFFTTKDPGRGTGLGLATVFDIVRRSDGAVHLYSEVGLGTTVTVLLPASLEHLPAGADAGAPPALEDTASPSTVDRPGARVLVVDDQPEVAAAAAALLEGHGYDVVVVPDGIAAVAVAEAPGRLDLLLTDIVMPAMTGVEVAERFAELRPTVPVVFMSGYAPPMLLTSGRLPEGGLVVDKPFTAAALLAVVRTALAATPSVAP